VADSRLAERRAEEARTLAREAELQALRLQLNPHFLFNSLHSIAALATLDGPRAREMCLRLAEFLRISLKSGDRENVPLSEEIALARSYLEVERVRFGARLRVEERIDTAAQAIPVPALLLQPLVENAVKHGIAGLVDGGVVRLSAEQAAGGVAILIENDFDPAAAPVTGTGRGLAHVRRRLAVRYGSEAALEAAAAGGLYRVALLVPGPSPITSSNRA
jgi:LytS/YehU family sensor histidine kinase